MSELIRRLPRASEADGPVPYSRARAAGLATALRARSAELLAVAGIASLAVGLWLVAPALAFIVVGVVLLALAVVEAR